MSVMTPSRSHDGRRNTHAAVLLAAALCFLSWLTVSGQVAAPAAADSVRFAVIGDNGTGDKPQHEVGAQMNAARTTFPFEFVIMLGDNLYGRQEAQDFVDKFERPYAPILAAGVPFFAALGNHDDPKNRFYKAFNMDGQRYYTFARKDVRFVVFDTNRMDAAQLSWIEETLKNAREPWKICYFHHPLYSDAGRHGPDVEMRVTLEPLLVRYGVSVVFSGHEHVYERVTPQKGITYFVAGSGGQLRKGDLTASDTIAAGFDRDQTFMLVEIAGNELRFQTVSRTGLIVDSGVVRRRQLS
jgi:predicted MPP superfamily phosphohydrolase